MGIDVNREENDCKKCFHRASCKERSYSDSLDTAVHLHSSFFPYPRKSAGFLRRHTVSPASTLTSKGFYQRASDNSTIIPSFLTKVALSTSQQQAGGCFYGAQLGSVPGVEAEGWQGRHHE